MSKKLFVGGLAWATTDDTLHAAFAPFGEIIEAKVICERQTGRSRGFGFVTFVNDTDADAAREALHGQTIDGRTIRIDSADQAVKRSASDEKKRPRNFTRETRPNTETREANERRPRHSERPKYVAPNDFPQDTVANRRDTRKKDRKSDRDRYEDEERW